MFKHAGTVSAFANPNIDSLQILTNQIWEFDAKFINDKFGLRLASVLQYPVKMVK